MPGGIGAIERRQMIAAAGAIGLCLPARRAFAQTDPLPSWNSGAVKEAIANLVSGVTISGGTDFVSPDQRFATFDNDGTLWSEQPVYFQVAFALDRVRAMVPGRPDWKNREPFRSVLAGDKAALAKLGEKGLLQIVGSSGATEFRMMAGGKAELVKLPKVKFIDDGPGKPVAINRFTGQRPILSFGNSDGDQQMLEWTAAGAGAAEWTGAPH